MRGLWLLPLLAACAAPGPGGAGCAGDFSLANQSGREIEQLYAGGARDLLEPGTMPSGSVRGFRASQPAATLVRIVFTDGRAAELGPVDLCRLPRVVVTGSGMQAGPP